MAVTITHPFVSPVADAGDPDEVGPNEWNAAHTVTGLGTAAEANTTDFATAAQGAKADSALQSVVAGSGISVNVTDPQNPIITATGSGTGDMLAATYDPQAIAGDAFARANHTGTQSADTLTDGTTNKAYTATEKTKLAGIATGATANSSDATLLARANHTGTQAASTISDFSAAADARVAAAVGVSVQAYDADLTTWAGLTPSANAQSLVTAADYAGMRALLDLEAGTDFLSPAAIAAAYQPLDADLTAWAGVNPSSYSTTAQVAAAYQPLDTDLTAIAGLSTQTFGRARLTDTAAEDARNALDTAPYVATRTALKALDTSKDTVAILTEAGRTGTFVWMAGNYASLITADTLEGIYVKADAIASSAGAWVRLFAYSVTAKWWGAAADNSTDDQAALNAAMATEYPLYIDGLYKTSAAITYAGSGTKVVFGNGNASSRITTTSGTADILVKNGTGALILREVGITTTVDKSAGTAVRLLGSGSRDLVENCMIYGADATHALYIGIGCETELIPSIRSNYILSCKIAAIRLEQTGGAGGEGTIFGNTINTAVATPTNAVAIHWYSGQGTLNVFGNRIQSYGYGVLYQPADGDTTAALLVNGNAFENNISASVGLFLRASGTALMQSVVITGNRFYNPTGASVATAGATNTDWIDALTIVGNEFKFGANYTVNIQACNSLQMSGNTYYATAGSLTAILTAAAIPLVGQISDPRTAFVGVATRFALNGNPNIITCDSGAPVNKTGDFTVALNEESFTINKGSTCTVTLPDPTTCAGRKLWFNNEQAFALNSATSNVVAKAGGAAAAAILPATDGAWAMLRSNGTAWKQMISGT